MGNSHQNLVFQRSTQLLHCTPLPLQSSHADAGEPSALLGLAAGVGVSLAAATPTATGAAAVADNDDSGSRAATANGAAAGPALDPVSKVIHGHA